ncbi:hypothetical protein WH367_07145 [Comamonas sp. MYb21]|uniref:hypothetical protein n=1 Tax=Comamonas sp. MYb21 TaxID=1848648 RepID=UPI0030B12171
MTEQEILSKIQSRDLPLPRPRDVGAFYAAWLATVFDALTPEQQEQAITLGGVVNYRSTYLVPVLKVSDIDGWLMQGGEGVGPLTSDGSLA